METYKIEPKKKVYRQLKNEEGSTAIIEDRLLRCENCQEQLFESIFIEQLQVCHRCGYHHKVNANDRVKMLIDEGTFCEFNQQLSTKNPLDFEGYNEKLLLDKKKSGIDDAIITGKGQINGYPCVIAVMESLFRMGSMGVVVGEKIYRAVKLACKESVPIIIYTASGGARMQEGMYSLMQMAKTIKAFELLKEKGLPSIVVMTHPTTGGVSASFVNVADIILAEPQATIGFAGRKVIEQTLKEVLPKAFQSAEFLYEHGHIDDILTRNNQKSYLTNLLSLFESRNTYDLKVEFKEITSPKKPKKLNAKEYLDLIRKQERPNAEEYIKKLFCNFVELHGDRMCVDDQAVITGIGMFHSMPLVIIGQNRGKNYQDNVKQNFGMSTPAGFRKVKRVIEFAEKFSFPILSFIDTKGADPTASSEQENQSWSIAQCIQAMLNTRVPTIATVIGEGGSGGALAVSVADRLLMLEKSVYSVISAEGAASILWKDKDRTEDAANSLKITSFDLLERNLIDGIIPEVSDDIHKTFDEQATVVEAVLLRELKELFDMDEKTRLEKRTEKYFKIGSDAINGLRNGG